MKPAVTGQRLSTRRLSPPASIDSRAPVPNPSCRRPRFARYEKFLAYFPSCLYRRSKIEVSPQLSSSSRVAKSLTRSRYDEITSRKTPEHSRIDDDHRDHPVYVVLPVLRPVSDV